jgi:phosphate transport system permease protein
MTDIAANGAATTPQRHAASADLVAKRYAAERRFRFYGIAAIVVTAVFLVALLADILMKGLPAFIEHRLVLPIVATQEAINPAGTRDPKVLLAGDYDSLIRDALRAKFPSVKSRGDRKKLGGLLSSGAADDFRRMITGNPALIGAELKVPVLLSDDADQYLKGLQTGVERRKAAGMLTITPDGDGFAMTSTAPDFAEALARIKTFIAADYKTGSRELARLTEAAAGLDATLKTAETRLDASQQSGNAESIAIAQADADKAKSYLASLSNVRDALKAKVDLLSQRVAAPQQSESLSDLLPSILVEANGGVFRVTELGESSIKATALAPPKDMAASNAWTILTLTAPETTRRVNDQEAAWLEQLKDEGVVETGFAWRFLTSGDSREPELAGLRGALIGTLLTLAVTLALCLPIGVGAAVYLEQFAPRNRLTEIIEININNLAAVPSIVFGLLGLAMFLNFFDLPRSAPRVGGLVLALLVLPTIIIASRAALKAVPPSIKQAALGVGASHQQAVFHHILPLAMPGIMTGTIIGMAHALGETAPLLMIGMIAFIVDVPRSFTEAATVLPVQIYLWSDLPEPAFQYKTAAAILVLLVFLFVMNGMAIWLRKRFERRW